MSLSKSDIERLKRQFISNKQVIQRAMKRIEIVAQENDQLMKLLSETKTADNLLTVSAQKAIARRNSKIKYI